MAMPLVLRCLWRWALGCSDGRCNCVLHAFVDVGSGVATCSVDEISYILLDVEVAGVNGILRCAEVVLLY